jgi:hypothetical protein
VCRRIFEPHLSQHGSRWSSYVAFGVSNTDTALLCKVGQRFLRDVSTLLLVVSSSSSTHVFCVFCHCLTWTLMLKTFIIYFYTWCYPKKFPKFLYRSLTTSSNFYLPSSPLKQSPLEFIQRFQWDFHDWKHFWKSFHVSIFIMFCDSIWIYSVLSKCHHLSFNWIFGNIKKITAARSSEYRGWGMTILPIEAKNWKTKDSLDG